MSNLTYLASKRCCEIFLLHLILTIISIYYNFHIISYLLFVTDCPLINIVCLFFHNLPFWCVISIVCLFFHNLPFWCVISIVCLFFHNLPFWCVIYYPIFNITLSLTLFSILFAEQAMILLLNYLRKLIRAF